LCDKEVAIKVIRHDLDTKFFIGRFKNESRILASLGHPRIGYAGDPALAFSVSA
jgi:serine/threonine protein kinase